MVSLAATYAAAQTPSVLSRNVPLHRIERANPINTSP
jgi:hypothetical protein